MTDLPLLISTLEEDDHIAVACLASPSLASPTDGQQLRTGEAMLRNTAGRAFSFNATTEALFNAADYDPKTSKPLVRVTGLVDETGRELPPVLVTCNTLVSMGEGAKLALSIWAQQGPRAEGSA